MQRLSLLFKIQTANFDSLPRAGTRVGCDVHFAALDGALGHECSLARFDPHPLCRA